MGCAPGPFHSLAHSLSLFLSHPHSSLSHSHSHKHSLPASHVQYDVLALDPEDLLEEDAAGGAADEDPEDMNEALSEYKVRFA